MEEQNPESEMNALKGKMRHIPRQCCESPDASSWFQSAYLSSQPILSLKIDHTCSLHVQPSFYIKFFVQSNVPKIVWKFMHQLPGVVMRPWQLYIYRKPCDWKKAWCGDMSMTVGNFSYKYFYLRYGVAYEMAYYFK